MNASRMRERRRLVLAPLPRFPLIVTMQRDTPASAKKRPKSLSNFSSLLLATFLYNGGNVGMSPMRWYGSLRQPILSVGA